MRVDGLFGSRIVNPSADLDARLLTKMAEQSGGHFYRARNTAELAQIYAEIDKLEPSVAAQEQFRPIDELFRWPLAAALLIVLLAGLRAVPLPHRFAVKSR